MTELANKSRITIHIADALDSDRGVVEVILDNSLVIEISKINNKLISEIFISIDYMSQPIDLSLLQDALRIAAEQAKKL